MQVKGLECATFGAYHPSAEYRPINEDSEAKEKEVFSQANMVIAEEVEKLLKAEFIEEVYYLNWLANVVLVKKSNEKWKMCVDFTDLNKSCPKDSFSLPQIDLLVDSIA
jgi:hypothetical protein